MASLGDLGLSEYESRAYRSLLDTGPTTAKELSRASDVPMGRIYDVLNGLEQYNLVRSQASSRPKKYVAVEPDTALDRLLEDKKRELQAQVDQYEQIVEELSEELEAAEPVEEQFWTAAVGEAESADLLIERLSTAEDRILMAGSREPSAMDVEETAEQVVEQLVEALERGVDVRLLMSPDLVDALPPVVGERYQKTLSPHPACEVRTTPDVAGTFNLVDDTEVCVQVPNPLPDGRALGLIDLKDPEFAREVEREVQPLWERAEPLSF